MGKMGLARTLLCVALGVVSAGCNERHDEGPRVALLHLGAKPGWIPTEERVEVVAVPEIVRDQYGYSLSLPSVREGIKVYL